MKRLFCYSVAACLLSGGLFHSASAEDELLTLRGEGMCAKCELQRTEDCQNAVKVTVDGKETVYLLTPNEASKAFHRNICSGTAPITIVGVFTEIDDQKFFVANKLSLRQNEEIKGEALCLKCALGLTPACQNGVRVGEKGKQVLFVVEHNDVSKAFHQNVCQKTAPVVAVGKVEDVAGLSGVKKLTATSIVLSATEKAAPAEVAEAKEEAPPAERPESDKPSEEAKTVTIKGVGLCAKCALSQGEECQNAIRLIKDGKEVIYLFTHNDVSKAFHKHVCSATPNIVAVGALTTEGDQPVFTPTKYELQKSKTLAGTGLCLKCELQESRVCRNAVKVEAEGKELFYILDQNGVSKKFHRHICQAPAAVVVKGTVAVIDGKLEVTPSGIELKSE